MIFEALQYEILRFKFPFLSSDTRKSRNSNQVWTIQYGPYCMVHTSEFLVKIVLTVRSILLQFAAKGTLRHGYGTFEIISFLKVQDHFY